MLTLARTTLPDAALPFLLEDLDTGVDAYLVAAAAAALRSYPTPNPAFAPFVVRAITNIRYRDERLSFESYGGFAIGKKGTSPVRELLTTLAWLGPNARAVISDLESLQLDQQHSAKNIIPTSNRFSTTCRQTVLSKPTTAVSCPIALKISSRGGASRARRHHRLNQQFSKIKTVETITFGEYFPRASLDRRVLLHALRQPAEVFTDDHQAGTHSKAS